MRNRLSWFLLAALFFVVGLGSRAEASFIYFVVAESGTPVHGDSYILPLENPDHIAHARELIVGGPDVGSPIAVARIAKGPDGINRDFLAPGEPLWSWHVTQFEGFADATIELIDGWPTFVEQDVDGWIANTNGYIGYWHYTVVAEVPAIPEPGTFVLVAGGLGGFVVVHLTSNRRRNRARDVQQDRERGRTRSEASCAPVTAVPFGPCHLSRLAVSALTKNLGATSERKDLPCCDFSSS